MSVAPLLSRDGGANWELGETNQHVPDPTTALFSNGKNSHCIAPFDQCCIVLKRTRTWAITTGDFKIGAVESLPAKAKVKPRRFVVSEVE